MQLHKSAQTLGHFFELLYKGGGSKKENNRSKKLWYQDKHDPNAMDIDYQQITGEKHDEYRKKGLCFACGQHGHMANNRTFHPKKTGDAKKPSKGKKVRREASDDETDKKTTKKKKKR